ncbi:hypothetical protein B0H13DRAFT_1877513 [Mycena leptocephala]|nr:hypothetical protein B0H13DRAFT_1877513 [Mycena leptocephala]
MTNSQRSCQFALPLSPPNATSSTDAQGQVQTHAGQTLERRAEVAWLYRRRNREAINEKARLRMQNKLRLFRRREELRSAPAAVQAEHQAKARQYRQKYLDRNRPVSRPKVKVSPAKKNSMDSQKKSRTSTELGQKSTPLPTVHVAPVKPMNPVASAAPPTGIRLILQVTNPTDPDAESSKALPIQGSQMPRGHRRQRLRIPGRV